MNENKELLELVRLANIKLDSIISLLNTVLNKYKIVENTDDEHDEGFSGD